jgi:transcriptional regulator of heat shock response
MATTQKTNKAVERLAESTRDSYQTVVDHAVGLQERNIRFAQGVVDGTIKELRYQAESNRSVVGELFERAEDQREAYQTLVEQSVDASIDLAYAPFTY